MGPVPSQYGDQYQGLSVPADDRLPWNPFPKEFQFQENKNFGNWQPWNYSCFENRNNENRQNYPLFIQPECFSSAVGSLGKMQTKPGVFETDQSMNFQDTFKENRTKHFQKSPKDIFLRKMNRKNRKRYRPRRVLKQIATDTTVNSSLESRQQSYKNWSHVPVLEWSQSNLPPIRNVTFRSGSFNEYSKTSGRSYNSTNLPPRPAETNIRKIAFRSGSLKEYNKIPDRSHNLARSELNACNFSGNTSKATASRAYFKSDNNSARSMGSAVSMTSYAKLLSGANMKNSDDNFNDEDDVTYLFSVDSSSEEKLVLEIDLQSDGVNLIPNSSTQTQKSQNEDDQSIVVIGESEAESNMPLTRKRKLSTRKSNEETSKRPSCRPRCMVCLRSYDDVTAKKQNMFISSSCSHVFCGPCISKDEKSKVCPACEIKFISFRRLYV